MEKDLKQFIEKAKQTKLSLEEKNSVRESVLNFIKENPVRVSVDVSHLAQARPSLWSNIFLTKLNFAPTMAIALVLVVLFGSGVSLGAEKALPGDTLYPVKIVINEEVRGWFAVSEEAKANWEIERVGRRLEEAEELATEGVLSDDVRNNIEAQFEAHSERVKNRIEKFETKENFNAAVDVSSKFETSLEAHEKILNRLGTEARLGSKEQLEPIRVKIRSRVDRTRKNREKAELKVQDEVRLEGGSSMDDNNDDDDDDAEIKSESGIRSGRNSANIEVKLDL